MQPKYLSMAKRSALCLLALSLLGFSLSQPWPTALTLSAISLLLIVAFFSLRKSADNTPIALHHSLSQAGIGIAQINVTGHWLEANDAVCQLLGYSPEALQQLSYQQLSTPEQFAQELVLQAQLQQGQLQHYALEKHFVLASGHSVQAQISVSLDHTTQPNRLILVFAAPSAPQPSAEELAQVANYDSLTQLPNRQFALQRLQHAIDRAKRHDEIFAVLMIDLDHFKNINDSLGHRIGDKVLVNIAQRLQHRLRREDTLARVGGDEFLVVLSHLHKPEEAALIARALLQLFSTPFHLDNRSDSYLAASIGISVYPNDGQSVEELLRNTDSALNQAKAEGRSTYRYYTQALTERANRRLHLESQLHKAIKKGQFQLHYQPLVNADNGQPFGVEALLRWQSDEGLISPNDFIPLAEETGLIIPIGAWALREACRQVQQWRLQGVAIDTLAVNLSPRQLHKAELPEQVAQALLLSGLPAHCLELEITEGALMKDVGQAQRILATLKQQGVRLSLDDFGTGYSSLAYLRSFELDKLKVDQSFVRGIPNNHSHLQIIHTIADLANSMGLSVLAEGVEQDEQWRSLQSIGCDYCQGYLFSRPLSADDLPAFFLRAA